MAAGFNRQLQRTAAVSKAAVTVVATKIGDSRIEVKIENPVGGPLAFFNRIFLVDKVTKKRNLPVFYSDNYVSVLPGEEKTVFIDYRQKDYVNNSEVSISGWNVDEQYINIK